MDSKHYIPGAVPSSLDDTADYPPLPESAAVPGAPPPAPWPSPAAAPTPAPAHATDTWVMPKLADLPSADSTPAAPAQPAPQAVAPQPSLDELLRPYVEEREGLRAELADAQRDRDELQRELERREADWRTEAERAEAERAERHAAAERAQAQRAEAERAEAQRVEAERTNLAAEGLRAQLEAAQAEHGTLRAQLEAAQAEHATLRAQLEAAQAEHATLRAQLEAAQAEHATLRAQLDAAQPEHATLRAQLDAARAEHATLRAQLEAAQAELARLAGERERQAVTQSEAERDRVRREAALAHSHEELSELHRRVTAHSEALRRVEGQRHIFDAQLREREVLLDEALARAEQAERRLARSPEPAPPPPAPPPDVIADPALVARLEALEAELAGSRAQADELQRQLADAQQAEQAQRLEFDHRATLAPDAAAESAASPWPSANEPDDEEAAIRHAQTVASGPPAPVEAPVVPAASVPVPDAIEDAPLEIGTQLLVRTSGAAGIVHVLGRRTTIGRTPDNDLRIEADYVSRHHAVVLVNPERTVIEDLNSTNGVYVNGARVTRHELLEGDVLSIGDTSFRFVRKPASA